MVSAGLHVLFPSPSFPGGKKKLFFLILSLCLVRIGLKVRDRPTIQPALQQKCSRLLEQKDLGLGDLMTR
jgi:hypothetical protein